VAALVGEENRIDSVLAGRQSSSAEVLGKFEKKPVVFLKQPAKPSGIIIVLPR
jgi:hypothetical protein